MTTATAEHRIEETAAAGFARALIDLAASKGADPADLARRAGIDAADLDDPDRRIPFERYKVLMREAKAATGDPALALHFGEAFDITQLSIVGLMGQASSSAADAFAQLGRFARLAADVALEDEAEGQRLMLKRVGGQLWLVDMRKDPNAFPEMTESAFARMATGARHFGGGTFLKEAHFTHPEPPYRGEYDRIFALPLVFSSRWNAFLMSGDEWMQQPTRSASPYVLQVLRARAEGLLEDIDAAATMRGRVERLLIPVLHAGGGTMAATAAELGLSRATLARRLKAEGTTFERLLDDLRRRLALDCLAQRRMAVGETAALLGFSEPAAFSRAFRRWTGRTPRAFRASAGALDG